MKEGDSKECSQARNDMVSIDFVVVGNAKIQVWFYASCDCSIDDTSDVLLAVSLIENGEILAHAVLWNGDE